MSAVIAEHQFQGSEAWHEYRAQHGNASEAAALMGVSPFFPATPYQLAQVKLGIVEVEETEAMRRGSRLEAPARAFMEDILLAVFEPQVVEGPNRMSASLDGQTFDGAEILEIKVPLKGQESETWRHVERHDAPPSHYWWQIQQQLLCSGAKLCTFAVCEAEGEEIVDSIHCEVAPDMQAHQALRQAWDSFWERLDAGQMPELTDRDVVQREDAEWRDAVSNWKEAKHTLDAAKEAEAEARAALVDLAGERSAQGCGIKISRYWVKGSTDYRKAATDAGVDLSAYEKQGRWQTRITEQD